MYRKVVRLPDGSKVRISGVPMINTKAAAEEAEKNHINRLLHPVAPLFKEFAKDWLRVYPTAAGNRPSMREQRLQHLQDHLIPFFEGKRLDQINGEQVALLFAHLREKKFKRHNLPRTCREKSPSEIAQEKEPKVLAPNTVRGIGGTLRRVLTSAVEWGKLEKLPPWPKLKTHMPDFDWYTKAESAQLLAAATDPAAHALLLFALRTGARAGEILALRWSDFVLDEGACKVKIRRSVHKGHVDLPKNGKGREVPLSADLAACLKDLPKHETSDLVFHRDGKQMELWHLTTTLEQTAKKAGLRVLRFHDLRHSFASQLVTAGAALVVIQGFLGHGSIVMTQRYAHLAPGTGSDTVNLLCGATT